MALPNLKALYDRGVANGVPGLRIISKEEVHEMEPNLEDDICAALYAPSAGIVCPFNLNIALAENANVNGVEFKFDTEVTDLKKSGDIWEVHTNQGVFETKYFCIVARQFSCRCCAGYTGSDDNYVIHFPSLLFYFVLLVSNPEGFFIHKM